MWKHVCKMEWGSCWVVELYFRWYLLTGSYKLSNNCKILRLPKIIFTIEDPWPHQLLETEIKFPKQKTNKNKTRDLSVYIPHICPPNQGRATKKSVDIGSEEHVSPNSFFSRLFSLWKTNSRRVLPDPSRNFYYLTFNKT